MNTNHILNNAMSDPYLRDYSRYPAQAVQKPAVINPSRAMVMTSARNTGGLQEVNSRPRNGLLQNYRNDRAPEAMNADKKELYYQVCMAKERYISYQRGNHKAHIAHLQAMLAREHMWFMRLVRGLCLSRAPLYSQCFCSLSYQL